MKEEFGPREELVSDSKERRERGLAANEHFTEGEIEAQLEEDLGSEP